MAVMMVRAFELGATRLRDVPLRTCVRRNGLTLRQSRQEMGVGMRSGHPNSVFFFFFSIIPDSPSHSCCQTLVSEPTAFPQSLYLPEGEAVISTNLFPSPW